MTRTRSTSLEVFFIQCLKGSKRGPLAVYTDCFRSDQISETRKGTYSNAKTLSLITSIRSRWGLAPGAQQTLQAGLRFWRSSSALSTPPGPITSAACRPPNSLFLPEIFPALEPNGYGQRSVDLHLKTERSGCSWFVQVFILLRRQRHPHRLNNFHI
jgi:hypothetical protein